MDHRFRAEAEAPLQLFVNGCVLSERSLNTGREIKRPAGFHTILHLLAWVTPYLECIVAVRSADSAEQMPDAVYLLYC
jgi:hypothetical protein